MEGQAAFFAKFAQLHPDHEAQTACHDEEHDDGLHIIVVNIRRQRRIRPEPAKQVKACIAERRDGRENADPDPFQPELRHKGTRQQHNANSLEQECQPDDDLQHLGRLRIAAGRNALAQQPQVPEAHPPLGRQCKKAGQRDQAQTADLDEQQDHHLAEHRPVRTGIDADEARDAGR